MLPLIQHWHSLLLELLSEHFIGLSLCHLGWRRLWPDDRLPDRGVAAGMTISLSDLQLGLSLRVCITLGLTDASRFAFLPVTGLTHTGWLLPSIIKEVEEASKYNRMSYTSFKLLRPRWTSYLLVTRTFLPIGKNMFEVQIRVLRYFVKIWVFRKGSRSGSGEAITDWWISIPLTTHCRCHQIAVVLLIPIWIYIHQNL